MGFKFIESKTVFEAEVQDGILKVYFPGDEVLEYNTTIKGSIPRQRTGFSGKGVSFCLEDGNMVYVGRTDGSWTGYRISDNFLMKQGSWDGVPRLLEAGNFISAMMAETVYCLNSKSRILIPSTSAVAFISPTRLNIAEQKKRWFVGNPLLEEQLLLFTQEGTRDYTNTVQREHIPIAANKYLLG